MLQVQRGLSAGRRRIQPYFLPGNALKERQKFKSPDTCDMRPASTRQIFVGDYSVCVPTCRTIHT
jgi:hypothetical protein